MAKRFGFTYIFCNDLEKMKHFYTEVLQLDLIWDSEDAIAFKIGEHQLSITYDEGFIPAPEKFAMQPGWEGGTEPCVSWSLECDVADFHAIVDAVKKHEIRSYFPEPNWKGYWSFPVLDPMNHTVEITCTEEEI